MRYIPDHMASALAQEAAKVCHVWLIRRTDGVMLGFTDHDRDLVFLEVACAAATGLTQGAAQAVLGLDQASNAAVSGVLTSEAISAADIKNGIYDDAEVRTYTVDWASPTDYVFLGLGYLAQLEANGGTNDEGGSFVAHVDGLASKLDRVIGRRFGSLCDAVLGDARCGLTLADLATSVCDKRYNTCFNTFSNNSNFRGFPDLPGEDFLTIYPRGGDVMNGGSRGQSSGR